MHVSAERRRRRRGNSPERILARFLRPASRGVLREDRGRDAEATKGPGRASPSRRFPGGQVRPAAHTQAPQTTASAKIPESGRAQTRRGLLRRPLTSAPGRPRRDQASPSRHVARRPKAITGSLEGGEPFQWGTVPSSPSPALLTPPPRRTPSPSRPNMRPRASCSFTRSARSAARPLARLDRPPSTSAPSKFSCRAARFHKRVLQRAKGGLPPHAGRLRNA